jgi:Ca-activated chloride channel family protein
MRRFISLAALLLVLPCLTGFAFPGSVQRLWRQADRAFSRKQFDRAQQLYNQARQSRPRDWNLMYNATVATAANKQFEGAIRDFQVIATSGPQELREPAEFNTGNCYLAQQQAQKAIDHYKRALYLKPDDVNAKWNLELAKKQQKQQQQQNKNQQQQQQKKQPQNKPDEQKQKQQQQKQPTPPQPQQMDKEQARQLLQSLSQQDRDLQKKLAKQRNQPSQEGRPSKDW